MVDEMGFVRLGARFEPTTRKIGFVAAAPGDVAGATAGWIRSLGDGTGVDEIPGGLEAALTRMGGTGERPYEGPASAIPGAAGPSTSTATPCPSRTPPPTPPGA